jgi:inorganic pyrophosphatase
MAEAFMTMEERKAQVRSYLGKTVHIGIDRPIGYVHHKEKYDLIYPINYGYIPGVLGGDGEELDVYLLGVENPVEEYDAEIIAIVHRHNDVEDKLVGAPKGMRYTAEEIARAVHFQEQYYNSEIEIEK